jgi:hypothetical protein
VHWAESTNPVRAMAAFITATITSKSMEAHQCVQSRYVFWRRYLVGVNSGAGQDSRATCCTGRAKAPKEGCRGQCNGALCHAIVLQNMHDIECGTVLGNNLDRPHLARHTLLHNMAPVSASTNECMHSYDMSAYARLGLVR